MGGKNVAICGCDERYITEIWTDQLEEGVFPQTSNEALVTENAKQIMGVAIGDPIAVETPDGDKLNFTISGFMNNTASIMSGDSYGIILNTEDYCTIYPNVSDGEPNDYGIMFYAQFANTRNIQGKIADLKEQCNLSDEQKSAWIAWTKPCSLFITGLFGRGSIVCAGNVSWYYDDCKQP